MRVFLSWSGNQSQRLAAFLRDWLPQVIQAVDPWMSQDIDKGDTWQAVMDATLEETTIGILCLTQANMKQPWIHFEAGAIHRAKGSKVCTLLIDLTPSDVEPPLSRFQHTLPVHDDVSQLLTTINSQVKEAGENALPEDRLEAVFEKFWPELGQELEEVRAMEAQEPADPRNMRDLVEEILTIVRRQEREREIREANRLGGQVFVGGPSIRDRVLTAPSSGLDKASIARLLKRGSTLWLEEDEAQKILELGPKDQLDDDETDEH